MYKKYLSVLFLTLGLLLVAQYSFNYLIDPYGFHSLLRMSSFKYQKIHKPISMMDKKPSGVIIGNSRNLYSFELSNTGLKNYYNLSLGGVEIQQVKSLLVHSQYIAPIKEAIISLDSICDPSSDKSARNSIDDRFLLGSSNSGFILSVWKILLYSSLDTTFMSFNDLEKKNADIAINENGRRLTFDEFDFVRKGYGYALKEREFQNISRNIDRQATHIENYAEYKRECKTVNLDFIIKFAMTHTIKIKFFLNPVNIRYWEIADQTGKGNNTLLYKKLLIQEKLAGVPLQKNKLFWGFDFLRLNMYTKENLSYKVKKNTPSYWYESSHYKLNLGNLILNAIDQENFSDSNFVIDLKKSHLENDFKTQLSILNEWEKTHESITSEIQNVVLDLNK